MRVATITGAVLLLILATAQPIAQQHGVSLPVPFHEADMSVPGYRAVSGVVDFAPGGTTGTHFHGGDLVGYIVSGTLVLEQNGVAPRVLNAGDTFVVPARTVHSHTNQGHVAARMYVTYVVEKSKPVTTPVR